MDATIRNVDAEAYRALKSEAARRGRTIGEELNEAIRFYLERVGQSRSGSLRDVRVRDLGPGTETDASDVDGLTYGS